SLGFPLYSTSGFHNENCCGDVLFLYFFDNKVTIDHHKTDGMDCYSLSRMVVGILKRSKSSKN
ncbi:MAG: hypothetical protein WCL34_14725, partial [Methylococcaceae bacterium]